MIYQQSNDLKWLNFKDFRNTLERFIREKIGNHIAFSCSLIYPQVELSSAEYQIVEKAVDKRKFEFSAGRYCAHNCLLNLKAPNIDILRGKFGEPLWPPEITGSITHNNGIALAVAMNRNEGLIGIDLIDITDSLPSYESVLNEYEISSCRQSGIQNSEMIYFSIKESVIKILSPSLKEYIEFKDIMLDSRQSSTRIMYKGDNMNMSVNVFFYNRLSLSIVMLCN